MPRFVGESSPVGTSQTPSICTISGTTVTAIHAGTCTIAGSEAASANYNAAVAVSDPTSTTETVSIEGFPAPQTISVVADDLTVAVGDTVSPTSQVSGLFDGDSVDNLNYDFYSGATLLPGAPSDPGTYRVVPKDGTLTAASTAVYSNPTAFTYVAATLVITALPPTIATIEPATGPTSGSPVTITGTRLDTVRSVRIGSVTLRPGDFTVNADGTVLTFTAPRVTDPGAVALTLVAGTASAGDTYVYTTPTVSAPGAPTHVVAVGHDRSIAVTFTPPASSGGAAITGYQVSVDNGRTWYTVRTSAASYGRRVARLTGLLNGLTYPTRVRAVTAYSAGAASSASTVIPNARPLGNVRHHPSSEVAVPRHPENYHGPREYTTARRTSHNGTWAHKITVLGARQLTVGEAATLSRRGLFRFDSAVLTAKGLAEVRTLAAHLRLAHAVLCEGYTDYAGRAAHELSLSRQRAIAVCQSLREHGARVRTVTRGYGPARPVVIGGSAASREANRRVVVVVTG